ncbi:unnamed protein product [[Candida] boidinii]|uniref:Unnamed protein product n=1 Tax=Candida boidinii TaxID=5477 RepID=A0A9W6T3D7_CANBO|nr:unnamed protein product [[Candida] boidinii]
MGANSSKLVKPTYTNVSSSSIDDELVTKLQSLLINTNSDDNDGTESETTYNPITLSNMDSWETELLSDPKNQLALNCFTEIKWKMLDFCINQCFQRIHEIKI